MHVKNHAQIVHYLKYREGSPSSCNTRYWAMFSAQINSWLPSKRHLLDVPLSTLEMHYQLLITDPIQ